jgi:magnesium and cobalt transporter
MTFWLIIALLAFSAVASLLLATLTYSLRDYSRARLADAMDRRGRSDLLEAVVDHSDDLAFLTALGRLMFNMFVLVAILHLVKGLSDNEWIQYLLALSVTGIITMVVGVTLPHVLATQAGEGFIAFFSRWLLRLLTVFRPFSRLLHATDSLVSRATRPTQTHAAATEQLEEEIEAEILSVIEEGEKEGVVDESAKEMIESVIEFSDTTAGQVMTARPDIVALPIDSPLSQIRQTIEESGHSRVPLYDKTLDQIVGVIYARDLIRWVGEKVDEFDPRAVTRSPLFVPETKPLRDLLQEFRLQKVHIAIVLDEYGGTAGLVTIEDVLEELVGDISDEHEPKEPAMFERVDDQTADIDARLTVYDLNRLLGLEIPEDAGYDTVGGFVSTTLGHIPPKGETFEWSGARFTVLDAEPQRVARVRIELIPEPQPQPESARTA